MHIFSDPKQRQLLAIALPMIASNLTIPLLSLVDTAVLGHLEHARYLGGVALGGSVISLLFMLLGFLRMSTTGLTAQAFGANNKQALRSGLLQASAIAIALALLLLLIHPLIWPLVQQFSDASAEVLTQGERYFQIRIWSAPATLLNMVLLGWFLGLHNARLPMWLLIVNQGLNIVLDLLFVLGFGWRVEGVAAASVLADYSCLLLGLYPARRCWRQLALAPLQLAKGFSQRLSQLLSQPGYRRLFALNRDIFIRSLCLQLVFVFMAFQGAGFGDNVVAANAVLLSFLMLVSYALDGFAYAAEACTGKEVGAANADKENTELNVLLRLLAYWALALGILFCLLFKLFGEQLISLLTSITAVQNTANQYLPWLMLLPLISVWSYLIDGIYIGATQGRAMRNSMLISFAGFGLCYLLAQPLHNHGLWLAFSLFMLLRGLTLGLPLYRKGSAALF